MTSALITGAGGFIGGHLTRRLLTEGYEVFCIDRKPTHAWEQVRQSAYNQVLDVADVDQYGKILNAVDEVYHLAEDMGGMGFLAFNNVKSMNSIVPTINLLNAITHQRVFFSSSACVYPEHLQTELDVRGPHENEAYPAYPDMGYGWEKIYVEQLLRYHALERNVKSSIARYHNVYGPYGTWQGGREKAPAAICRKVARAALTGRYEIDIWGDGEQQRSFMHIDDCIEGTRRLMSSGYTCPFNVGSSELVSINQLVDVVETIAFGEIGRLQRAYQLDKPQGVRGRNSENTLIQMILKWEPSIPLATGLAETYSWIYQQVEADLSAGV